jgi:hypothetical protein
MVRGFEAYCKTKGSFDSLDEMVKFQDISEGRDRYKVVDCLLDYVKERGGTYYGMRSRYSAVRSYFLHKRCELPHVPTAFTPTKDATVARMNFDVFHTLLNATFLRNRAIYLSLLQGLMDQKRFFENFNVKGYELGQHIKEKGVEEAFRIDCLRERKANRKPFNTWITRDALVAWKEYFDRERGYPKKGEAAALNEDGKPLAQSAFFACHFRLTQKLGYVKCNGRTARHGYNLHEFRDLARSIVEKAKVENFNTLSAEYWMGHTVDPLFYNKIWTMDADYNRSQYKIAEKYLNVLSGSAGVSESQTRIKELEDRLAKLEAVYTKTIEVKAE